MTQRHTFHSRRRIYFQLFLTVSCRSARPVIWSGGFSLSTLLFLSSCHPLLFTSPTIPFSPPSSLSYISIYSLLSLSFYLAPTPSLFGLSLLSFLLFPLTLPSFFVSILFAFLFSLPLSLYLILLLHPPWLFLSLPPSIPLSSSPPLTFPPSIVVSLLLLPFSFLPLSPLSLSFSTFSLSSLAQLHLFFPLFSSTSLSLLMSSLFLSSLSISPFFLPSLLPSPLRSLSLLPPLPLPLASLHLALHGRHSNRRQRWHCSLFSLPSLAPPVFPVLLQQAFFCTFRHYRPIYTFFLDPTQRDHIKTKLKWFKSHPCNISFTVIYCFWKSKMPLNHISSCLPLMHL